MDNAKKAWTVSKNENGYPIYREGVKYLQISTDEVYGSLSKDYDESIELVKEFLIDEKNYIKVAVRISKTGVLIARTLYKLNLKKFEYQLSKGDYLPLKNIDI